MRLFYIHQYFMTRAGQGGTRSYELAKRLIARGHEVIIITSGVESQAEFNVAPGQKWHETSVDGIRVVSVPAGYANYNLGTGMSGPRRFWEFYKFSRAVTRVGKQLPKPDLVYATHTPLTVGLSAMALSRHFGVPFVFEVRDLWPEALVNIGALTLKPAIWFLGRMAERIYRAAAHIVALSPGMKEGIVRRGIAPEKISVIPNACDLDLFRPDLDGRPARARLGLGARFAAIYFGAMGRANGLSYAVEAARILAERGRKDIAVVLHGQGGKRAELEALARRYGLSNVIFSDPVPSKEAVAELVAGADACLTIYADTHKETGWSPNKMFDALAAGRPVLINVPGWLGDTINNNGCGMYVDPDSPAALADALVYLADHPDARREMGENARRLGERQFSREALGAELEKVLRGSLDGAAPGEAKPVLSAGPV